MKRKLLKTMFLMAAGLLIGTSNAWGAINTDAKGRKQYVWNFGVAAKSGGATYYLQTSESTSAYGDFSANYGTSGTQDRTIAKAVIHTDRAINSFESPDADKGAGANIGSGQGYLEFYAPVSGVVTLVGTYLSNITTDDKTSGTKVTSGNSLAVTAGDQVQVYASKGSGIEKIVLTQTYYGETTVGDPSAVIAEDTRIMTITSGSAPTWTAGSGVTSNVGSETSGGTAIVVNTSVIDSPVSTYYTTNGTTPTSSSTLYSEPFASGTFEMVKFITISGSGATSNVVNKRSGLASVSTATTWDFASIADALGGFASEGTLYLGSNLTDDRASNKRLKFKTAPSGVPTSLGENVVSFKTGVAGQVIMKLVDYGTSSISVSNGGESPIATFAGESQSGNSQSTACYHGGGDYFFYATFQAESNTQYYIYGTAFNNAGVYSIEFQPSGTNITTAVTEETTWDFTAQKDILREYHGITKDNMFYGEGVTEFFTGSIGYRIHFGGAGNTSTGANVISFKVPANTNGNLTVIPSCYNDDIVLTDGSSTLATYKKGDHGKEVATPITTTSETTLYLYTEAGTPNDATGIRKIQWTPITSMSKTISAAGWATYCSPYPLDFSGDIENLTDVYIITGSQTPGAESGYVAKTSVKGGTVPANTGLLIKGSAGTVTIPVAASSSTNVDDNKLVGVTANTVIGANTGYVLMASPSLGFYKNSNAFTVGANTAYLPASFAGSSEARFFSLFNDDVTSISDATRLNDNGKMINDNCFDLQGRRVAQPTRGLYIVNGKKVIIK